MGNMGKYDNTKYLLYRKGLVCWAIRKCASVCLETQNTFKNFRLATY